MPTTLGTVTDRYRALHCIAITPAVELKRGSSIRVAFTEKAATKAFEQPVTSIQVKHTPVDEVAPGISCGIKIDDSMPLPPLGADVVLLD